MSDRRLVRSGKKGGYRHKRTWSHRCEPLEKRDLLAVVISEFMAENESLLADVDGEYSDWIELHNDSNQSVSLSGWYLSDDDGGLTKWRFPDVSLAADGYLVVFASNKDRRDPVGELHTNFRLGNGGEYLGLTHADGVTVESEFAPRFPPQIADISYGIGADDVTQGFFMEPTPRAANLGEPVENPQRAIVISEIMYSLPTTGILDAENVDEEFIELYNRGTAAVNLQGWTISAGVDFTFPNVSIAPGGYLAVAANITSFQSRHPGVANVVGGWTGKLSNSGEAIEITDDVGVRIDRVEYADSGNWSVRTRGPDLFGHHGWIWNDGPDGGGKSLELVNFGIGNQHGQNWRESAPVGGTPGRANSVASVSTAPLILDIEHSPPIPRSSDPVAVSARLLDELSTGLGATLFWRVDGQPTFSQLAMTDSGTGADERGGDGVFTAVIPAQPNNTVVEFYVGSSDGTNQRTWPAPVLSSGQQEANLLYQVNNSFNPDAVWQPGSAAQFYQIMTAAERAEFTAINRLSDAQMNATFISVTGTGTDVVYNTGVRIRGSGSRNLTPPNNHINFPEDARWHGLSAVNMNVDTVVDQIAGGVLSELGGLHASSSYPAIMYSNNVNLRGGTNVYAYIEALDGDWVANHYPGNSGGNLYKGRRPDESPPGGQGAGLQYVGEDPAPYVSYTKLTNESEADWTDVIALTNILNNTPAADYAAIVESIVDVDQWLRTLAFHAFIDNTEFGLFVGDAAGDDYAMYRGDVDTRFRFVTHDLDTLFSSTSRAFFRFRGVPALDRMMNEPTFLARYYEQLVDITQDLTEPDALATLDIFLAPATPTANITSIKQFLVARRDYILSQVPAQFLPAALGDLGASPAGIGPEHGPLPVPQLRINEILADNIESVLIRGSSPDLIELYNDGPQAINLQGMSLSDDRTSPRKYVFPAGAVIEPKGYLQLIADVGVDDEYLHVGFSLDSAGEGLYLFATPAQGGAETDGVDFGMQISDYSIGRANDGTWNLNQPTLGSANLIAPLGSLASVSINEWLASADVSAANDLLELYSSDSLPVALGGAYLSDKPNWIPTKHAIAPLSFIAPSGYLRLIADGESAAGPNHLGFQLSADQDMVALFDANLQEIDRVLFVWQTNDISEGRTPDGATRRSYFAFPTPGLPNADDQPNVINVLGFNATWRYDDSGVDRGTAWRAPGYNDTAWRSDNAPFGVETSVIPVPLETPLTLGPNTFYFRTNLVLNDDPSSMTFRLTSMIDDGMIVYVNGTSVLNLGIPSNATFSTPSERFVGNAELEGPFTIPGSAFVRGNNTIAVELHQGTQGTGDIVFSMSLDRVVQNSSSSVARSLYDNLRVTEVNYHPVANGPLEYLALQNRGSTPLPMAGVRLSGGIDYIFPMMTLDPQETVVVVQDVAAFRAQYGTSPRVVGSFIGRLDNDGDSIVVNLPDPHAISALRFDINDWWYPATDGLGQALGIRDIDDPAADWDERLSWQAVTPTFSNPLPYDLNNDGSTTAADLDEIYDALLVQSTALVYDLNHDRVVDTADMDLLLTEGLGRRPGDANLNGTVDGTDLAIWQLNLFMTDRRWGAGDFNADGTVDGADFNIWNLHKFQAAPSPAASSPAATLARVPRAAIGSRFPERPSRPSLADIARRRAPEIQARRLTQFNRSIHSRRDVNMSFVPYESTAGGGGGQQDTALVDQLFEKWGQDAGLSR